LAISSKSLCDCKSDRYSKTITMTLAAAPTIVIAVAVAAAFALLIAKLIAMAIAGRRCPKAVDDRGQSRASP